MQFMDRINAIETRARTINSSLPKLCRESGVDVTRLHRWKTGENSPTLKKLEECLGKLERAVSAEEDRILRELSARRPEQAA